MICRTEHDADAQSVWDQGPEYAKHFPNRGNGKDMCTLFCDLSPSQKKLQHNRDPALPLLVKFSGLSGSNWLEPGS